MRVFFIASCLPAKNDNRKGVLATHVQVYEHLKAFTREGHQVAFQAILNQYQPENPSPEDLADLEELSRDGVCVLESIPAQKSSWGFIAQIGEWAIALLNLLSVLSGRFLLSFYYPTLRLSPLLSKRIREQGSDLIFFLTSPEGIAACASVNQIKKIAYQGDLDFSSTQVRMADLQMFGGASSNPLINFYRKQYLKGYQRAHIKLMKSVDTIANSNAANVEFYQQAGHKGAYYGGPTWRDEAVASHVKKTSQTKKIIGHVGYLNRTASAYGVRMLLREVVPLLRKKLIGINYEVHVIGGGALPGELLEYAKDPSVKMRDWVEDLNQELRSGDVFVFLNNVGPLKAAFSRPIIAWSMGLCLIAHSDQAKTLPEVRHGYNALLGGTGEEIAEQIKLALTDGDLNQTLRANGRKTYETNFHPSIVCQKYFQHLKEYVPKGTK